MIKYRKYENKQDTILEIQKEALRLIERGEKRNRIEWEVVKGIFYQLKETVTEDS